MRLGEKKHKSITELLLTVKRLTVSQNKTGCLLKVRKQSAQLGQQILLNSVNIFCSEDIVNVDLH